MDIAALVRAVIAAFDDASKLVARIGDQRSKTERALREEPTRDLLESLALGPVIVRGHYDHDVKRFGEPYACGDIQAREQMKDVLINMQMTLIITLRSAFMDDIDLDFNMLQTASDDCRVNAGVCLGQLSQRLSDSAKAQAMYPQHMVSSYSSNATLAPPMSPSLAYSSSRSTQSSGGYLPPRTPDNMSDQFPNIRVSASTVRPPMTDRTWLSSGTQPEICAPRPDTQLSNGSFGGLPIHGVHRVMDPDALSMRRPSSHTLAPEDSELLSPANGSPPPNPFTSGGLPGAQDLDRDSFVSSAQSAHSGGHSMHSANNSSSEMSRVSSAQQSAARDREGPEDFTPVVGKGEYNYTTIYDMYRPQSQQSQLSQASSTAPLSYSNRAHDTNHSTLEHIRFLQQNARPPRYGINQLPSQQSLSKFPSPPTSQFSNYRPREDSLTSTTSLRKPVPQPPHPKFPPPSEPHNIPPTQRSRFDPRPSISAPIPVSTSSPPPPPPPTQQPPNPPPDIINRAPSSFSTTSLHSLPSRPPTNLAIPTNVPLTLPTDKIPLNFCRSAIKLFIGLDLKKSFSVANRPVGLSGLMPYWSCSKCNFEGPVVTSLITDDSMGGGGGKKKKKKGKEEKVFDGKVRVSNGGGVRYKWVFLAKCHVPLKGQVVDLGSHRQREGEVGGFGCVFCCAEGGARGWSGGSGGSVKSGSSGGDGKGAPVFGNVETFLEHLEMHRGEEGWPGAEMLGRMRCVVGRVAGGGEDWEVNFVPVEGAR